MNPKISDVAEKAGVSKTTVSRVLNNRGYISQETKDAVYGAMKELNYFPNDVARSLFNKKTNLIGLILPTVNNPFFSELAFYIESICAEKGYKVLLCNSSHSRENEERYLDMLLRNQVDGIIVCSYNRGFPHYNHGKMAVVAIDHYLAPSIPVVGSDNYNGGKLATGLLLEKGCQNIIHINGPIELATPANLRRKAYEDVIRESGREPIVYENRLSFEQNRYSSLFDQIFAEHPEVDGVFASDDLIAAAFIQYVKKKGLRIPEDIKVIGYDGSEMVQAFLPELSSIQQPIKGIAQECVRILSEQIDGEADHESEEVYLPVRLMERETT
ncbi:LacI family DNA-binding transcriptional regulator [Paenibacillus sp. JDR-2]|uniref:LacI family DNA-binding transcriptional regulator n=1 Tax=Paenibacillus sp. (strain JDR-2) TaxID=324057 RepID=UPI0001664844|nr:LacI family DNA-binding transcriptional regulator [Paenibacillus sp. JDR-2]ACT03823.1 transcriptional regulator, LacI family [Paenibacillus sp. JDR-2]